MKETELAQKFVDYLSCFDLYFEVDYHRCIDIVAIEGNISIAYEVKTAFNFKELEQAIQNAKHFHYSYICVPDIFDDRFQRQLCRDYGIGLLTYNEKSYAKEVNERVRPRLNRHANITTLKCRLSEQNKKSIPGSKNGESGKITAFGVTIENAVHYVRRNPECTMKELVQNIKHHYRSDGVATACLAKYIYNGVIKDLTIENRRICIKK